MNTPTTTLNNLIEICKDGQYGFQEASEKSTNPELKRIFGDYSVQRARFAGDLRGFVISLGEEPADSGSIASAVHRGWIDLKAAFTKGGDHPILTECERGEEYAMEAYQNALREDLPAHIREVVDSQYKAVLAAHSDIHALCATTDA